VTRFFRHRSGEMAATEQSARAARALDDLYRHHAAEIYRYVYAVLGNHADAEDVTQATFINALRALERGETPRKPSNWLLVIAHNLIRQRFRQAQARPAEVALNDELARAAPEREDDGAPTVDELIKALGRIPATQREAIVMREFEGRSYAEIVEILGITTSALETLLFRARRSLADELESLVTCQRAEEDLSRLLDGRLTRREKRRLLEHVRSCPSCARFEAFQRKQRRALKALALLPLPVSLTLFKGVHGASAAVGLPTIGAGATGASVSAAAAGGGAASGGMAIGGVAVAKVAAVVAAAVVAGGAGYEGVTHVDGSGPKHPATPAASSHANKGGKSANAGEKARGANARGQAVSAAHKQLKPKHTVGRHHVPGGLVDATGTARHSKGKSASGGPANGNAYGGASRAHGSPSGKTANGRGTGSTKSPTTKTAPTKPSTSKTATPKGATTPPTPHTKTGTSGGGAAAKTADTSGGTTDVTPTPGGNGGGAATAPDANAGANGVAAGPGSNNGKK